MQRTVRQPASIEGVSLHTGETVKLTVHPAPANSGVKFRRRDLPDEPIIEARIDNVKMVERATTLVEGNVKIHTVEHVLSALAGLQIDNAVIEMDANEPPIADGSAAPFVAMVEKAGIQEQDAPRRIFELREPVHIETKTGSILAIFPDPAFRISCTQVGPGGSHTQFQSFTITPEIYSKEIAPARTFVHYEDIQPLIEKGLIRGGSLDNAVVIKGSTVTSKEPLRFPDEFVRHKILDLIGDLALFGQPLRGHVVAVKPGHGPNSELTRAVQKEYLSMRAMVPPPLLPQGEAVLDITEVMRILPHRYPFLLVDRVISFEGEDKCTGVKSVTINEPYFQGHFPGHPVMPGVLQVEAMAQVASILLLRREENAGKIGYFMSADAVKFRRPVFPGDTLFIHVEMLKSRRNIGKALCRCEVNNAVVSEGELMFGIVSQ